MNKLFSLAAIMALSVVTLRLSFDPPYRRAGLVFTDRELVVDTADLSEEQVERLLLDPAIGIFGDTDTLDRKAAEAAEAERVAQAEADKAKAAEAAEAERVAQAEADKAKAAEAAEVERVAQAEAEKAKQAEAVKAEAVAQTEASKSRKGKDNG